VKVAILAGGVGSRLSEETESRPKPMIEIGGQPMLWHIMKIYSAHGFTDFVIALGYRGDHIKRWAVDFSSMERDLIVDTARNDVTMHGSQPREEWTISLVDTGLKTQTGGRIKRLAPHLSDGTFMLTWGDGVADVDLHALVEFHRSHGKLATMTAVRPPARFGHVELAGDTVAEFSEKPQAAEGWINGAFFVCEPAVFDYIDDDLTHWEREPLERLARDGQLMAYRHDSFWQCMDTLRDRALLEELWAGGHAPWKVWS
jgi:glucose-1-phosphate cytidylyltransferase